jgi:hypothetical protein
MRGWRYIHAFLSWDWKEVICQLHVLPSGMKSPASVDKRLVGTTGGLEDVEKADPALR